MGRQREGGTETGRRDITIGSAPGAAIGWSRRVSKPETSEWLGFRRTIWPKCCHTRPGLELETIVSWCKICCARPRPERGLWCFKVAPESTDSLGKRVTNPRTCPRRLHGVRGVPEVLKVGFLSFESTIQAFWNLLSTFTSRADRERNSLSVKPGIKASGKISCDISREDSGPATANHALARDKGPVQKIAGCTLPKLL